MKNQQFTTVYTKGRLTVASTTPNTKFSHLLDCNCKTIGAENKERSYLLKRVNFYKFREYMETVKGVSNWQAWYTDNRALPTFNDAIADYINHSENRTGIYIPNDGSKLYNLMQQSESITKEINKLTA